MNTEKIITRIKNDKKLIFIIIIGFVGVFVLLFSGSGTNTEPSQDNTQTHNVKTDDVRIYSAQETEKILAEKVENLVSQLQGAGSVSVEVTVSSSAEYVYAENVKSESDTLSSYMTDREYVLFSDDTEQGLLICVKRPQVLGVAVICQGGGSAVVKSEVTELVTSLFDIGADKVYVGNKI